MQHVDLTFEEIDVLREILQHSLTEIDVEVLHTDTHEFKQMLKHRRGLLEQLLARLNAVPVTAAAA